MDARSASPVDNNDNIPLILILGITAVLECLLGVLCLGRYGVAAFSIYLLAAVGLLGIELYSWRTYIAGHRDCAFGQGTPRLLRRILLVDAVAALALELGTLIGAHSASPIRPQDWHVGRIAVFFFVALCLSMLYSEYGKRFKNQEALAPRARSLAPVAIFVVAYLGVLFITRLLNVRGTVSWRSLGAIAAAAIACVIAIVSVALSKKWAPERSFALIALTVGLAFIIPFPATNLFSWDDEVHYKNANALSYVANVEETASDRMMVTLFAMEDGFSHDATFGRYQGDQEWSSSDISGFSSELDRNATSETTSVTPGMSYVLMQFSLLGYVPSATALWLGRLLHLSFTITYALGRVANLMSYVAVTYFAIKKIPLKKTLLCAIALLPTNIFLAANYSYDAWLTSWLFLAVALTIREIKSKEAISLSRWTGLVLTYFFALGPKAVYFPLVALLMLVPSSKFESKKRRRAYYALAIAMTLLVVATFALSFLASGGGKGDSRGGSEVSGVGQLSYAIANPVQFCVTVLSFVFGSYLTFLNVSFAFTAFAYLGYPEQLYPISSGLLVVFILLLSVCEGSKPHDALTGLGKKAWTLFLCLVTVILSSVALYMSFTAVGLDTVAGMQPRYMLPLVFPACALVLNVPHAWRIRERILSGVALSVSSLYLLAYTWLLFSSKVIA